MLSKSEPSGGESRYDIECHKCGEPASTVQLVPPRAQSSQWRLIFRGVLAGNGGGTLISEEEAARYRDAFSEPHTFAKVHQIGLYDDAGFCEVCNAAYCSDHWNPSQGGYGRCPNGHGKSLDPHWSPADYD